MAESPHSNDHISSDPVRITNAISCLLHVPVRPLRVDSQSTLDAWDVLAVKLTTDTGIEGWGYQTGFGPVMTALKSFMDNVILPQLPGLDIRMHKAWWRDLFLYRHHTGLNGPAFQGVSAPEIAAWDVLAKSAGLPLWSLIGGSCRSSIMCYDTNAGWLGYPIDELVENVRRSVDDGFRGVKVKIGLPDFSEDIRRLEAVRDAIGGSIIMATDVNNRWDLQTALACAPVLADYDVAWLEEPLYPFDIAGHAELGTSIETPLLHGENIYDHLMFRDMLEAGAMDIAQPSDMKLGGISRWLEVASYAGNCGKRVVPAGWTMMQIDQHLAAVTPHCWMVEWIPWIRDIFCEPVQFENGDIIISSLPGAGTEIKESAIKKYSLS
ncbi:mandelate racemase/muconate lactonizing enzyme family protein [Candidatus Latescibacterota bacterium]